MDSSQALWLVLMAIARIEPLNIDAYRIVEKLWEESL
jgi:hypothetical protein